MCFYGAVNGTASVSWRPSDVFGLGDTSVQTFKLSYSVADFVFKIGKYNASFLLFPVLNVIILYWGGL